MPLIFLVCFLKYVLTGIDLLYFVSSIKLECSFFIDSMESAQCCSIVFFSIQSVLLRAVSVLSPCSCDQFFLNVLYMYIMWCLNDMYWMQNTFLKIKHFLPWKTVWLTLCLSGGRAGWKGCFAFYKAFYKALPLKRRFRLTQTNLQWDLMLVDRKAIILKLLPLEQFHWRL